MSKKELEREAMELDEEIYRLHTKRVVLDHQILGEEEVEASELLTERMQLVRELPENPIPSILTISLRVILDYYREKIVKLKAEGGEFPSASRVIDKDYGITFNPGSKGTVRVDYKQEREKEGVIKNPIDEEWISKMHGYLDEYLRGYEGHPPDIPISELEVEIEDDKIAELVGSDTNRFDARFESDPPEPRIRSTIHSPESDYYQEDLADHWRVLLGQGFRIRNLNLKEFINTEQKFAEVAKIWKPIIKWRGWPSNDVPKSNYEIAGIIRQNYLPPDFAKLKFYRIMRGNRLALDGVR